MATNRSSRAKVKKLVTGYSECLAVNEEGYERTLEELSEVSVSNPKIRRAELFTRLSGFEYLPTQPRSNSRKFKINFQSIFQYVDL